MLSVRVLRAGFSPLKGTRHLALPEVSLDDQGVIGDRTFCLVDVEAARVLRTVQHPGLTAVVATLGPDGEHLTVTLPDGRTAAAVPTPAGQRLACDYWGRAAEVELLDGPHAALLSEHLGKPVRLGRAPRRAVIYGAGIAIVTLASLEDLAERAGTEVDPARFRSALVIDADAGPYAEESWLGRELRVGTATVRIGASIPRCAVIDIDPSTGARDGRLLKTLAGFRPLNEAGEPCFGVYAEVRTPGVVTSAGSP